MSSGVSVSLREHESARFHERALRQQVALMRLLALSDAGFHKRVCLVLKMAAEALEIERVVYWRVHERGECLRCEALYLRSQERFVCERDLRRDEHRGIFEAMQGGTPLVVDDVSNEASLAAERWSEVAVGALMYLPVYAGGELVGVVGHEHAGGPRHWAIDEQNFAISIAQLLSLANKAERLQRVEHALRDSERRFRAIVEASPVPMLVITVPDGTCIYGNRAAAEAVGIPPAALAGRKTSEFYWNLDERPAVLAELLQSGSLVGREMRFKHADGTMRWFNVSAQEATFEGKPASIVGFIDVSEHKRMENALRHMALHDGLTGLPNRALFHEMLSRELAHGRRSGEYRFAVLFVDLDNFKEVNDHFGHAAGDRLLVEIAQHVQACLRPKDLFARMGGDEFAVLLSDIKNDDEPAGVSARMREVLSATYQISGHDVAISGSIGVVLGQPTHGSVDAVMRAADKAMYRAKADGRERYVVLDGQALRPRRTNEFTAIE